MRFATLQRKDGSRTDRTRCQHCPTLHVVVDYGKLINNLPSRFEAAANKFFEMCANQTRFRT
jgi:hypothetical protein